MNNEIKIYNTESNEKKISKFKENDQFYFIERDQLFIDNQNQINNNQIEKQIIKSNKSNYYDNKKYKNNEKESKFIFQSSDYLIPPLTRIGSDKSSSDSSDGSERNLINNKTSFSLSKRKPIGNLTPTKPFDYLNERKLKRTQILDNNSIKSNNLDSNLSDNSSKSNLTDRSSSNLIDKYSNKSTNKLLSQNSSNRSTPDLPINQRSHCLINNLNKRNLFNNNLRQIYSSSNLFDSYQNICKFSSTFTLPTINSDLILSTRNVPKNAKTSGFIIGSSIYGQLIVVICLVLFTAEICTSLPLHYFEIYFFYLYSISFIFLFYVYIYLLGGVKSNDLHARESKLKKDKVSENENSYGSIFLRVSCIVFGLGSMIYNSLELGSYFEFGLGSPCHSIFLLLNPLLQLIFTFFQMYFVFVYKNLMINRFKIIARIGLIHLVATNVCTWIKILLKETLQTLHFPETISSHSTIEELILPIKIDLKNRKINGTLASGHHFINISNPCYPKDIIMGDTVSKISTYLYPFIVEYSLIGAAFLYVMWCHIGKLSNISNYNKSNLNYNSQHLYHHSNRQQTNCPHINNHQQDTHETNNHQRSRSGSISPSLSVNHLNNIDNNQVLFNTTNQMETNLNHNNLLDTNSSNCSPTNQTTNTSITPTSTNDNTNLTNVQCTPPTNRNVLMINTHQLTNSTNYVQSNLNQTANGNNSNAVLLDNISIGSSHDSFNNKFSGNLSYQVNSMYPNNLNLLNSTHNLYSCLGSSRGLFCGFLFLVCSIVSLIIFFVLFHHANYMSIASLINESSHSILLIISSISIIIAYFKIRKLKFQPGLNETADGGLRDLLLRVAAFGLYTYSLFGLVAGYLNLNNIQNIAVFVTSILSILQISLQSLFINDIVCRKRTTSKQQVPQQIITFLIIVNFIFWILYTFEMQKIEASPIQLQVYGRLTWGVVVRLTLPLSIFYRFHSAITFAEFHKIIVKS